MLEAIPDAIHYIWALMDFLQPVVAKANGAGQNFCLPPLRHTRICASRRLPPLAVSAISQLLLLGQARGRLPCEPPPVHAPAGEYAEPTASRQARLIAERDATLNRVEAR